jgi:hypothetical protein
MYMLCSTEKGRKRGASEYRLAHVKMNIGY